MLTRGGAWLGFVRYAGLSLGLGASLGILLSCASATTGAGADGGAGDDSDATAAIDAGEDARMVYPPPGDGTSFCAAGGWSQDSSNGSVRHYSCLGPVDLAAQPARSGSRQWQPGPIFRTSP